MNTMRLAAPTALVLACCVVPTRGGDSTASRAPTNHSAVAVNLFFGTSARDEAAPNVPEATGANPSRSGQAQSVQELRTRAIEAIKQVRFSIDNGYDCAVNIELSTGTCEVLLRKGPAPYNEVRFNSAGQITSVGGALAPQGEGTWHVDYTRGKPGGAGVRLAIALTNNVLLAGSNTLLKGWITNDSATGLVLEWSGAGPYPEDYYLEIWLQTEGAKEYVLVHGPGEVRQHRMAEGFVPGEVHSYRMLLSIPADIPPGRYQLRAKRELHGRGTEVLSNPLEVQVK